MADYSDLIDKICEGNISEEEQQLIDQLLQENDEFVQELKAQREIMGYFDHLRKKEQLNKYHEELLQSDDINKIIPFRKRTWLMAASIIFFFSISTFALLKLYLPPDKDPIVIDMHVESEESLQQFDLELKFQQYALDGSRNIMLTGEQGSEIHFPAGCFIDGHGKPFLDDFNLELLEITDPDMITAIVDVVNSKVDQHPEKLIYLQVRTNNASLSIDLLNAPRIMANKIYKGVVLGEGLILDNIKIKDYPIMKVTSEMEAYLRYQNSKLLLDSINAHYTLQGNSYHPDHQKGLAISEEFIKGVKKYIRKYETDKNFEAKVNKSRNSWYIHNKQREIVIGNARDGLRTDQYLTEFGWYGIFF